MNNYLVGLWHNPDFMKLWLSQTVSQFGSRITRDVLPLVAVITLSATPTEMGLLTAIPSIPILIFSLYAGVWIDRLPRLSIMIAVNLIQPLILLLIPLAAITGNLTLILVLFVSAAVSLFSIIFEIAYRAVLPSLVSHNHLVEGNSKLALTDSLAEIGGPAIAGLLVQWFTAPMAILVDVLSYLVAAVSLYRIRNKYELIVNEIKHKRDTLPDMIIGWRFLFDHPLLRPLILYSSMARFFGSFIGTLYALFAIQELNLSPSQLGLVIAGGGIGAVLGAMLSAWLSSRLKISVILISSLITAGVSALLIPFAHGSPTQALLILMGLQIVGDAADVTFSITETSLRQSITPDGILGRVNASGEFLVQGIAPMGGLIAGLLATQTSLRFVLFVAGCGILLSTVWVIASPIRSLEYGVLSQAE